MMKSIATLGARSLLSLLALLVLAGPVAAIDAPKATVRSAHSALDAWQLDEASLVIDKLSSTFPTDPEVAFLEGKRAFLRGEYAAASAHLEQAKLNGGDSLSKRAASLQSVVDATAEVVADHVTVVSPDGRFQVRYPAGKDAVLVPFVFDAMGEAYDALAADFGVSPPVPVRIEIYADPVDLAHVSPLTEDDIETTGTIALCKYNRLMLTSPKAMVRGYGWIDTLVHEFVHMVVNQASRNQIPIWLHEGLAKFSERRWRGGDDHRRLPPYNEWLLHKRATDGEIVTFEQMHPSMAKLPSAEDAAMAYASVYAAMEMIHGEHGIEGLRTIVKTVGEGSSVEEAIAAVTEGSFKGFLKEWKSYLTARPRKYTESEPPDMWDEINFRQGPSVDQPDDSSLIEEDDAREFVHLGDLLLSKKRPKAAAVEYRRAGNLLGGSNPILQARVGRVLLDIGEIDAAIDSMKQALDAGEIYVSLYVYLGQALVRAERWNEAFAMLQEAAAINPFDPAIHVALSKVYAEQGDPARAQLATDHAKLVVSRSDAK